MIYNISFTVLIVVVLVLVAKHNNKFKKADGKGAICGKEDAMNNNKQIMRSKENKMFTGVCGGIGEYFDMDANIVRLLWVLTSLASMGTGLLIYAIFAIFLPQAKAANSASVDIEPKD